MDSENILRKTNHLLKIKYCVIQHGSAYKKEIDTVAGNRGGELGLIGTHSEVCEVEILEVVGDAGDLRCECV